VEQQLIRRMTPAIRRTTAVHWTLGAIAAALAVFAIGTPLGLPFDTNTTTRAAGIIFALAIAPLFVSGMVTGSRGLLRATTSAAVLVSAYALGHAVFTAIATDVQGSDVMQMVRYNFVIIAFGSLYMVQAAIATQPSGRIARALYPACFAGFYLDEIWTRYTFRLWPPRALPLPPRISKAPAALRREVYA
jgi:NAD(P)H-quinone oxidoreductase subunit 5